LFDGAGNVLAGHRGWDPGALDLFRQLAPIADADHHATVSRLLVELNRSLHHPALFSPCTKGLPHAERQKILDLYYHPYRSAVERKVAQWVKEREQVMHVAVHSFTPVLNGGCAQWTSACSMILPGLRRSDGRHAGEKPCWPSTRTWKCE
jgi:predicted N-formylglutamate amidohydrolase